MLIPFHEIVAYLQKNHIQIDGALHVGAHECEEIPFYGQLGIPLNRILWIDAIPKKVEEARQRGIPNVLHAVITDKDNEEVDFHVSNNVQSSSIFEFGTHAQEHPSVVYVNTLRQKTITIDTLFRLNNIDAFIFTFWNFDIQGAELLALKGAIQSISFAKALYLEVNEKELYRGCALVGEIDAFLLEYGFKRVLTKMTEHGWGDALYLKIEMNTGTQDDTLK
jgi:hypothetical protein